MRKLTNAQRAEAEEIIDKASDTLVSVLSSALARGYITMSFKRANGSSGTLEVEPTQAHPAKRKHYMGFHTELAVMHGQFSNIPSVNFGDIGHKIQTRAAIKLGLFTPKPTI